MILVIIIIYFCKLQEGPHFCILVFFYENFLLYHFYNLYLSFYMFCLFLMCKFVFSVSSFIVGCIDTFWKVKKNKKNIDCHTLVQ